MRLLILGGTRFVGRHITEAAVSAGHEVILANRGRTSTDTLGTAGRVTIDRDTGDLAGLADTRWDAVVDVSAYTPAHVADLADAITAERYLLVSTVSVYDPAGMADPAESAPLREPAAPDESRSMDRYGELKVACEQVAEQRWGDARVIVRPGIVAGPHDPTDRFTWWTRALATTPPPPLPDARDQDVQVIDARDLAAFCLHLLSGDRTGPLDVTGEPVPLAGMVEAVAGAVDADPSAVSWVPVEEHEGDLPPLVLDPAWGQAGIFSRSSEAARAAGLERRPLAVTAADTRAWDVDRGLPELTTGPPLPAS